MPVLLACCILSCVLCGCTRREQLVLEAEGAAETAGAAEQAGNDRAPDDGAEDESVRAAQSRGAAEDIKQDAAGLPVSGTSGQEQTEAGDALQAVQQQVDSGEAATICVHVCGAVENAGVYELPIGSRVFEAVKMAGGFTDEADENYVNQAQQLADGSKLVIPTIEQVQDAKEGGESNTDRIGIVEQAGAGAQGEFGVVPEAGSGSEEAASASDGKININTASEAQLCEIPGIGAARAAAIVAYRQEAGGFSSIEDIMNVSGIKEGTYAKIKDRIKVN